MNDQASSLRELKRRFDESAAQDAPATPEELLARLPRPCPFPAIALVVTTLPDPPEALYRFYVQRGRSENWIKDLKNAVFADRLSCHLFAANQFRLFLHTAAYVLLFRLRERLAGTALATCQMDTLRLKLLKIGARVQVSARRIWFHLASGHPCADVWLWLARSLASPPLPA